MPWYWSDDIARALREKMTLTPDEAARLSTRLVAFRRPEATLGEAIQAMIDDDEIPLAA